LFSSRRRHTRSKRDWSSDVCSSDLAIAEGAKSVANTEVTIKRVPETMPQDVVAAIHAKTEQAAPIASPEELGGYDAIIIGTPTRFGNMAGQMRNFLDQTGGLWAQGKLIG